mmetsp:Transcript_94414/g.149307  ORF Transcript_94414/g.149307 Transcript_94414/m.149307 type:complete len:279 (+) Transcript_94414:1677-2513(+)
MASLYPATFPRHCAHLSASSPSSLLRESTPRLLLPSSGNAPKLVRCPLPHPLYAASFQMSLGVQSHSARRRCHMRNLDHPRGSSLREGGSLCSQTFQVLQTEEFYSKSFHDGCLACGVLLGCICFLEIARICLEHRSSTTVLAKRGSLKPDATLLDADPTVVVSVRSPRARNFLRLQIRQRRLWTDCSRLLARAHRLAVMPVAFHALAAGRSSLDASCKHRRHLCGKCQHLSRLRYSSTVLLFQELNCPIIVQIRRICLTTRPHPPEHPLISILRSVQ